MNTTDNDNEFCLKANALLSNTTPVSSPGRKTVPATPQKPKRNNNQVLLFDVKPNVNQFLHQRDCKPVKRSSINIPNVSPKYKGKMKSLTKQINELSIASSRDNKRSRTYLDFEVTPQSSYDMFDSPSINAPASLSVDDMNNYISNLVTPQSDDPTNPPLTKKTSFLSSLNPFAGCSELSDSMNAPHVVKALQNFSKLAESISPEIISEAKKTAATVNNVGDMITKISPISDSFQSAAMFGYETLLEHSLLIELSLFGVVALNYVYNPSDTSFAIFMVVSGAVIMLARSNDSRLEYVKIVVAILALRKIIGVSVNSEDTAVPQSFESKPFADEEIGGVAQMLATLALSLMVGTSKTKDMAHNVFNGLGRWNSVSGNIKEIMTSWMKVIDRILEFVTLDYFKDDSYVSYFMNKDRTLAEIDLRLKKITHLQSRNEMEPTDKNYQYVEITLEMLKSFIRQAPRSRDSEGTIRLLTMEHNNLTRLRDNLAAKRPSLNGMRSEPTVNYIAGSPGNGKTAYNTYIARMCLVRLEAEHPDWFAGNAATAENQIYYRRKQRYIDGYVGQLIWAQDDAFQQKDVAGAETSEALEIIDMINTIPYSLNMADVESKGKTYFKSEIVLFTSNTLKPQVESIISTEALMRRMDHTWVAVPRDEYVLLEEGQRVTDIDHMNRKMDTTKLKRDAQGVTMFAPENIMFFPYRGTTCVGSPVSIETVIDSVMSTLDKKKKWHKAMRDQLDEAAQIYKNSIPKGINVPFSSKEGIVKPESAIDDYLGNSSSEEERNKPSSSKPKPKKTRPINSNEDIQMEPIVGAWDFEGRETKNLWGFQPPSPGSNITVESDPIPDPYSSGEEDIDEFDLGLECDTFSAEVREITSHFFAENKRSCTPKNFNWMEQVYQETFEQTDTLETREFIFSRLVSRYGKAFTKAMLNSKRRPAPVDWVFTHFCDTGPQLFSESEPKVECLWQRITDMVSKAAEKLMDASMCVLMKAKKAYERNKGFIDKILMILFILSTAGALASLAAYCLKMLPSVPESINLGGKRTSTPKVVTGQRDLKAEYAKIVPQGLDPSGNALMNSIVKSNMYTFLVESHQIKGGRKSGYVLALADRIVMLPFHFVSRLLQGIKDDAARRELKVFLKHQHPNRDIALTPDYIFQNYFTTPESESRDVAFLKLPDYVQPHRDIVRFFLDKAQLSTVYGTFDVRIDLPEIRNICSVLCKGKFKSGLPVDDHWQGIRTIISNTIEHNAGTSEGSCGGVGSLMDARKSSIIIGMHVAGSENYGYMTIIGKEMLLDALKAHPEVIIAQSAQLFDNFTYIRDMSPCPSVPQLTELRKSKLYNNIPDHPACFAPANLRPIDGVHPLEKTFAKYCLNKCPMNPAILERAVQEKYDHIESIDDNPNLPRGRVSIIHAIEGDPNDPNFGSQDMSTSAGYPGNILGMGKKYHYVGKAPRDYDTPTAKLFIEEVEDLLLSLESGKEVELIFTDFPKDEIRPFEKVDKPRLISGAPFVMNTVTRVLCGKFSSCMMRNRIKNNSCLGINEQGPEWHLLLEHLTTHGWSVFAGDFSGFDRCHTVMLIMAVCHLINMWYGFEDAEARTNLFYTFARSTHTWNGKVWKWEGGMPSGNPLTAIINTITNELLMRYCYIILVPRALGTFSDNVKAAYVGDDNVVGPSEATSAYFNAVTLEKELSKVGYTYTDETKSGEIVPLRLITECEFLKRKWLYNEVLGRFVAPIREESIIQGLQWVKKTDPINIMAQKIDSAVREYSLHGPDKFNDMVPKILVAYRKAYGHESVWPVSTDYAAVLDRVVGEPFICY